MSVSHGHYCTPSYGTGFTDFVHPEERRQILLLHRESEIEHSSNVRFVLDITRGRFYRLFRRCYGILDIASEQRTLAKWKLSKTVVKTKCIVFNTVYLALKESFWIKKRPRDISTSDGRATHESHLIILSLFSYTTL